MTISSATVQKFAISGQFNPPISNPLQEQIIANLPFNFQNITVLNVVTGSYTPANDTKTIYSFGASEKPNFLLVTVDQQAVLEMTHSAADAPINSLPFKKTIVIAIPDLVTGTWEALILNGATAGICPMVQGVAMNYTVIAVTGQVT